MLPDASKRSREMADVHCELANDRNIKVSKSAALLGQYMFVV